MTSDGVFVERRKAQPLSQPIDAVRSEMRRFMVRSLLVMMFVFIPLAAYLAVTLHDEHIEYCKPPKDAAVARICDLTFPFHDHQLQPSP